MFAVWAEHKIGVVPVGVHCSMVKSLVILIILLVVRCSNGFIQRLDKRIPLAQCFAGKTEQFERRRLGGIVQRTKAKSQWPQPRQAPENELSKTVNMAGLERLQKVIARAGISSRRAAEHLVRSSM